MLFDSFEFGVLLAIVLAGCWLLPHRWQNRLLLAASIVFYSWWDWRLLSLILFAMTLDYYCALGIAASPPDQYPRRRKWILRLTIVSNLTIIGIFKYCGFFVDNFIALGHLFGFHLSDRTWSVILPVGISFYTFQSMSYTIDVYWGKMQPVRKLTDFCLFVMFFPQLVAGPIERAGKLMPQLYNPRRMTFQGFQDGAWLIAWGLFKKVFVADNIAGFVDRIYGAPAGHSAPLLLLATYAFAVQIYCDFSGYSDIAVGVGKMLGVELTMNFNLPYFASSPQEFWRRWHVSLSSWFRDYVFLPLELATRHRLGASLRVAVNLMATMFLVGLWHGAQWRFILWGIYHGLLLIVYRLAEGLFPALSRPSRWRRAVGTVFFFHLICFSWILFRGQSMSDIMVICRNLLCDWRIEPELQTALLRFVLFSGGVAAVELLQYLLKDRMAVLRAPVFARAAIYVAIYLCLTLGGSYEGRDFIYFQF